MERFLIALDCVPECLKPVEYVVRVLKGAELCEFILFHVLPTTSPDKLRMDEVHRIEQLHTKRPDLAGYFWRDEDEKNMERCFAQAKEMFVQGGFAEDLISITFEVERGDLADIIMAKADQLGCSTLVLGRRRISRVKELLLGSVSKAVLRMAHGSTVWVIAS